MQLRDIFFRAPLVQDFATAADGRFSKLNRPERYWCARTARLDGSIALRPFIFIFLSCCLPLALSGCLGGKLIGPSASAGSLKASPSSISFGSVALGQAANASVSLVNQGSAAVQVSNISLTGNAFSVSGGGDLPITVAAGSTFNLNVGFAPTVMGAATGQLKITTSASASGALVIGLSGTGTAAGTTGTVNLRSFSCANGSMSAAGTDSCTVTLSGAAPSGGFAVSLASNNSAVTVPASVTVAAGSTTASFTATVSSVNSSEPVTLTASANSVAKTFALQLGAGVPTLTVATTVAFGNVDLNTPATQSLTLSSTGTAAVTISAETLTGTGFTVSGATFPLTLNPNQTATLSVEFDPTATGAVSGQIILTSNSSTGTSTVVTLTGTGIVAGPAYEVILNWDAPTTSADPVAGYNVYRSISGASLYSQLNTSAITTTTYTDTAVQDGQNYDYIVESVDASDVTSAPSNTTTAAIP